MEVIFVYKDFDFYPERNCSITDAICGRLLEVNCGLRLERMRIYKVDYSGS